MSSQRHKICFISSGRMDFGLIAPLMDEVKKNKSLELQFIAMGNHASTFFGGSKETQSIEDFNVDILLDTLTNEDTGHAIAKTMACTTEQISDAFDRLQADAIVIPGDRYEMLAVAGAATVMNIPIIHLYGGDITYGAYDDSIRHAITKLSHLHFVSNAESQNILLQMGENPAHIFDYGSPALSYLDNFEPTSKTELEDSLNIHFGQKNLLITYHPATRAEEDIDSFIEALEQLDENTHLFMTMPNADNEGRKLYEKFVKFIESRQHAWMFKSLGRQRYLSFMQYVDAVIGNSSSGLYEAPSFKIPTINIGDRQKGRLAADSVFTCACNAKAILKAIDAAYNFDCGTTKNPYYKTDSAKHIVSKITELMPLHPFLAKEFFSHG